MQITSNFTTQQRLLFTFGGRSVSPLSLCGLGILNLASCFSMNIVKHFPLSEYASHYSENQLLRPASVVGVQASHSSSCTSHNAQLLHVDLAE